MLGTETLRIAIPSKGRLQAPAIDLLRRAGIRASVDGRRLFSVCPDTGAAVILSNTLDIPVLVSQGIVDLGISGSDQVAEKGVSVIEHRRLGFGRCRLSLAVHKDAPYQSAKDLAGKTVGSKFVNLATAHFQRKGATNVRIVEMQGAVEVMVLLGLVEAIVEIVDTGSSLVENDLVELERVIEAEAVLIGSAQPRDSALVERLLRRFDGVLHAARYSLLEYNCPIERLDEATRITPGFSSPTLQKLSDPKWCAVKVLVPKVDVHRVMDQLESIGCRAILESELLHTRL
jgi:ATP phosphoribosyltransferase